MNETRPTPIKLIYKNWKGKIAVREILPEGVSFKSTEWHPEPQWILSAFDVEKQQRRDFALADILGAPRTGDNNTDDA